jgi:ABC-type glycerol-3-phosphate transport system substrate-binding protein
MIKRALAGLATAVVAAAAFGALTAPEASAAAGAGPVGKPRPVCVWIWTEGPPECRELQ